jgi:hypothetical protein
MSKCLNCSIGNHNHCTNPSQTSVVKLCCCGYTASGAVGLQKTSESSGEPPTLRKLAPVSPNTNIDDILDKLVDSCYNEHLNAIKEKRIPSFTTTEAKTQLEALLSAATIDPYAFVEPCEPECSPERHAYHKGQWDMAVRIENEKTPEGADSYSLRLNTLDYNTIFDTLKDYALKLVANAHSEMSDEQWEEWLNEHTDKYAKALKEKK